MKVEEIPSDEIVEMTDTMHKVFNIAGCNPMCHCCKSMLKIGDKFKLSTIEELPKKAGYYPTRNLSLKEEEYYEKQKMYQGKNSYAYVHDDDKNAKVKTKEVMLCQKCTPKLYLKRQKDLFENNTKISQQLEKLHIKRGGGCFRINGKIVH